jgi:tetrahydromethanopterin S-methyltransferase subunit G
VGQEGAFNMFNDKGQIYYIVVDPDDLENIDTTLAFESLEEAKEFIAGESTTFDGF